MVSLVARGQGPNDVMGHFCAGVIVDEYYILTTAYCLTVYLKFHEITSFHDLKVPGKLWLTNNQKLDFSPKHDSSVNNEVRFI